MRPTMQLKIATVRNKFYQLPIQLILRLGNAPSKAANYSTSRSFSHSNIHIWRITKHHIHTIND